MDSKKGNKTSGMDGLILSSLPCVLVVLQAGKIIRTCVPKEMRGRGNEEKIRSHIQKNSDEKSIPPIELEGSVKMLGFARSKIAGSKLECIVGHDMTECIRREKALREEIEGLDKFRRLAIGRELTVIELKRQIDVLKRSIEGEHGRV